jgi:hypothetical protein
LVLQLNIIIIITTITGTDSVVAVDRRNFKACKEIISFFRAVFLYSIWIPKDLPVKNYGTPKKSLIYKAKTTGSHTNKNNNK